MKNAVNANEVSELFHFYFWSWCRKKGSKLVQKKYNDN